MRSLMKDLQYYVLCLLHVWQVKSGSMSKEMLVSVCRIQ